MNQESRFNLNEGKSQGDGSSLEIRAEFREIPQSEINGMILSSLSFILGLYKLDNYITRSKFENLQKYENLLYKINGLIHKFKNYILIVDGLFDDEREDLCGYLEQLRLLALNHQILPDKRLTIYINHNEKELKWEDLENPDLGFVVQGSDLLLIQKIKDGGDKVIVIKELEMYQESEPENSSIDISSTTEMPLNQSRFYSLISQENTSIQDLLNLNYTPEQIASWLNGLILNPEISLGDGEQYEVYTFGFTDISSEQYTFLASAYAGDLDNFNISAERSEDGEEALFLNYCDDLGQHKVLLQKLNIELIGPEYELEELEGKNNIVPFVRGNKADG